MMTRWSQDMKNDLRGEREDYDDDDDVNDSDDDGDDMKR